MIWSSKQKRDAFETDYEAGQDNIEAFGMDMHHPVFSTSAFLILVFVILAIVYPGEMHEQLEAVKGWSIEHFDWLFMVSTNIFLVFSILLIVLPYGRIRLGGENARPDFSTLSWLAMLFAAGMGIGLMYWGVAEPVAYYTAWYGSPLNVEPRTKEAMELAMGATMYHWGFHAWAIYALMAVSLAFFAYNKGLPLTIRSTFYPLLGERVWGRIGDLIDIVAALATIFGLATSLGLGARQASAGLNFLFDIPNSINTQIAIIIAVTTVATFSVIRGLHGGVKKLSQINMGMAFMLLAFVIITGPTLSIFKGIFTTTGSYLGNIIPLSNWIDRPDENWLHGWSVFYWAWWVAWSPFVGMFIARVSRGRTIREFMLAVLLIPTLVTLVWMTAFGGSALEQIEANTGALVDGISKVSLTTFQMLESLPFTAITSFVGICLVLVFFVTSSDSGSLVIDSITAGGKLDAPVPQRIFWATTEGLIAGTLLLGGGAEALTGLQAGVIATGLPFTIILLLMCFSLVLGLHHEHYFKVLNPKKPSATA